MVETELREPLADTDADRVALRKALNRADNIVRETFPAESTMPYRIVWSAGAFRPDAPRLRLELQLWKWSQTIDVSAAEIADEPGFRRTVARLLNRLLASITKEAAANSDRLIAELETMSLSRGE